MITSTRNPKIQKVRSLQNQPNARRDYQAFVVEGVRLAEEALAAGWQAEYVLYTEEISDRGMRVVDSFKGRGAPVEQVSTAVLKSASDTQGPQGILVVLHLAGLALPSRPDFVLILDSIRDPGNLGTILRTADAAGVQAVLLPPGSADAFAPKVVRSAMGAHFRLPIQAMDWEEVRKYLPEGVQVYLADSSKGRSYTDMNLQKPVALIIGGEAEGAGQQATKLAGERIHIPMPGKIESLNAAIATAVLLFEVARQRSQVTANQEK